LNTRRRPFIAKRTTVVALALLLAVGAVWLGLGQLDSRVDWVRVSAPAAVEVGQSLILRVSVPHLAAPAYLCVDLHWATNHHTSQGFLVASPPRRVSTNVHTLDFKLPVPARPGLRFVNGIIFLSPTGRWSDHSRVANTGPIPVVNEAPPQRLRPVRLYSSPERTAQTDDAPWAWPRVVMGCLLLAAAAMAGRLWRRCANSPQTRREACRWGGWALALAILGLGELAGWEIAVGSRGRALARAGDWYYLRGGWQKGVLSLVLVAILARGVNWWRQRRRHLNFVPFGLELYLALILMDLISLHAVDQFLRSGWRGLWVIHALKLGLAGALLIQTAVNFKHRQ